MTIEKDLLPHAVAGLGYPGFAHLRSPEEIAAFLASICEDATRLRQSSPFTNVLTSEECGGIYETFQKYGSGAEPNRGQHR